MKTFAISLPATLALLLSRLTLTDGAGQPKNSVLLRNIKSLTVYKDRMTTHRRVSALPQLTCTGGSGKGHFEIDVMRCTNSGASYDEDNVDWTCKASLPPEFKLGSTDVICEGYSSPDDPYILKGSCAVEYRLLLTELGEEKYGSKGWFGSSSAGKKTPPYGAGEEEPKSERFFNFVFWCLFVGVGLWIAYNFISSLFFGGGANGAGGRRRGGAGGGGGGWGGNDDDPPPPYDPRPPRRAPQAPRTKPSPSSSSSQGSEPWRPGFWTGTAAGAAAAYAANRASNNRAAQARQEQSFFNRAFNANDQPADTGRGWFGGGGGGRRNYDAGEGPSSSPSASRYESTGFGSTRRR